MMKVLVYAVFGVLAFILAYFFGGNKQYHVTDNSDLPPDDYDGLIPYAYAGAGDGDGQTSSEGCEGCEGGY